MKVTFTMHTDQNAMLKKHDISFSEQQLELTYSFYKQLHTELQVRRNIHNERYKRTILI